MEDDNINPEWGIARSALNGARQLLEDGRQVEGGHRARAAAARYISSLVGRFVIVDEDDLGFATGSESYIDVALELIDLAMQCYRDISPVDAVIALLWSDGLFDETPAGEQWKTEQLEDPRFMSPHSVRVAFDLGFGPCLIPDLPWGLTISLLLHEREPFAPDDVANPGETNSRLRDSALLACGLANHYLWDERLDDARTLLRTVVAALDACETPIDAARARDQLAGLEVIFGDYRRASELLERAVASQREASDGDALGRLEHRLDAAAALGNGPADGLGDRVEEWEVRASAMTEFLEGLSPSFSMFGSRARGLRAGAVSLSANPDVILGAALHPDASWRELAASSAGLPELVAEHLVQDPDWRVRRMLAANPDVPVALLEELGRDRAAKVRREVASNPRTPGLMLDALVGDGTFSHNAIQRAAVTRADCPPEALRRATANPSMVVRVLLARNPSTPPDALAVLADNEEPRVRIAVAAHPLTPADVLQRLARDPDPAVRRAARR